MKIRIILIASEKVSPAKVNFNKQFPKIEVKFTEYNYYITPGPGVIALLLIYNQFFSA